MSTAHAGEAKTDVRDAFVIAETVRHRGDLTPVDVPATLVTELRLLSPTAPTSSPTGPADQPAPGRPQRLLPCVGAGIDYWVSRAALVLMTGYQTPAALRARGRSRLASWLAAREVRCAEQVATAAMEAANAQHTTDPGQDVAASIVAEIAAALLELDQRIPALDARIGVMFHAHPQAKMLESMPGIGTILGAELIAAAGDLSRYADAGHLASAAGLVPVPRDSADAPATCTVRCATPASCDGCSTCPRSRP